jgi:hypothetical protein
VTAASRSRLELGPRTLFLGGVMIAIWSAFVGAVQDPDYWWHLRVGQWILDNRALPTHDLFTYTVPTHGWIDHEYLTEVLIALANRVGGMALVSVAFGIVTWLGFVYIWRTADVARRPYVIGGLALALGAVAGAPIWGPRAQMITFLFSCVELFWLDGYLRGRSRTINFLPLLVALWANLHGGFVVAFLFLVAAMAAEAGGLLLHDEAARMAHRRRLVTLARTFGLSLVALLATPHGLKVYLNPLETLTSPAQRSLIVEWFSPDFHLLVMAPFMAMILLLLAGFALRRPTLYQFFLAAGTLVLALESVRHVAIFVAATTPILVDVWSGAWDDFKRGRAWAAMSGPTSPLLRVVTVVSLVVILAATGFRVGTNMAKQGSETSEQYPVAAANWLAAHPEVGTRMYNQYGWGGYLADRFYPDPNRRVFIFGEASVMGDSFLHQYQDVQTLRPDWRQVLDEYRVDYIVYNSGEALDNVLKTDPGWREVYRDKQAVIYVRASSAPSA